MIYRAKFNLFETGTHSPLLMRAPWLPHSIGQRTDVLAEAIDLYPTMAALCGLPPPQEFGQEINGTDLSALFHTKPSPGSGVSIKPLAFSQFGKGAKYGEVRTNFTLENNFRRDQTFLMGYTVRSRQWRYTCWFGVRDIGGDQIAIETDHIIGREVYDHRDDFAGASFDGERVNLVDETTYQAVVEQHHALVLGYIRLPTVSAAANPPRLKTEATEAHIKPTLSFGQPQVVDKLKQGMPDDFLAFGTALEHQSWQKHMLTLRDASIEPTEVGARIPPLATLGREFNWLSWSQSAGSIWRNSTDPPHRHISSVIHHYPKQCGAGVCTKVTSIGSWTTSNGTYWETDKTYTFALNASAPHLLVDGRGPKRISFRGLPHPSQVKNYQPLC